MRPLRDLPQLPAAIPPLWLPEEEKHPAGLPAAPRQFLLSIVDDFRTATLPALGPVDTQKKRAEIRELRPLDFLSSESAGA